MDTNNNKELNIQLIQIKLFISELERYFNHEIRELPDSLKQELKNNSMLPTMTSAGLEKVDGIIEYLYLYEANLEHLIKMSEEAENLPDQPVAQTQTSIQQNTVAQPLKLTPQAFVVKPIPKPEITVSRELRVESREDKQPIQPNSLAFEVKPIPKPEPIQNIVQPAQPVQAAFVVKPIPKPETIMSREQRVESGEIKQPTQSIQTNQSNLAVDPFEKLPDDSEKPIDFGPYGTAE